MPGIEEPVNNVKTFAHGSTSESINSSQLYSQCSSQQLSNFSYNMTPTNYSNSGYSQANNCNGVINQSIPEIQNYNQPQSNLNANMQNGYNYSNPVQNSLPLENDFNNISLNSNTNYNSHPNYNGTIANYSFQQAHSPTYNQYDQLNANNYVNSMLPHKNHRYGYNRPVNLFQNSHLFPYEAEKPAMPSVPENLEPFSCPPEFMRCSLNTVPQTHSLLDKIRLPFGVMLHPFNDKQELPLVTDQVMARCKVCRTYINPFVILLDNRHWKCNICYRTNELPEEYYFDQRTRQYIQPYQREELKNAAIEFTASSDYMIRPPQPAVYIFLLEVSVAAIKTDYLANFCEILSLCLDELPGDSRTLVGFVTFDKTLHFYRFRPSLENNNNTYARENSQLSLTENDSNTNQSVSFNGQYADIVICPDVDEPFIPCEENLLVNLHENIQSIKTFLTHQLPHLWSIPPANQSSQHSDSVPNQTTNLSPNFNLNSNNQYNSGNCLGAALLAAQKLLSHTGGRISTFLHTIPNTGQGKLDHLNPTNTQNNKDKDGTSLTVQAKTDFYKRLALDFSNDQISADFFFFTQSHIDIASLATLSKFCAGCMYHFPAYHTGEAEGDINPLQEERFEQAFKRYLTRDIGFEAVLRVRCSKGLTPKAFYGNHFLRSSNLLCLPTVRPDLSYTVHMDIDEDLVDSSLVSMQAAILYTTSKGERRIRVLTLALPVSNNFDDIVNTVDQEVVVGLISVMASERCLQTNLHSAREAIIMACQDFLSAFNTHAYITVTYSNLMCPQNLALLPCRTHALLKNMAFKLSTDSSLHQRNRHKNRSAHNRPNNSSNYYFDDPDDRAFALYAIQSKPVESLMTDIYPQLYNVNYLSSDEIKDSTNEMSKYCSYIPVYPLSAKQLDERCSYLLDLGDNCLLFVIQRFTPLEVLRDLFAQPALSSFDQLNDEECEISPNSKIAGFLECLQNDKPYYVPILIIKEDNVTAKSEFRSFMYDDRTESSMSLQEFLLYLVKEIIS